MGESPQSVEAVDVDAQDLHIQWLFAPFVVTLCDQLVVTECMFATSKTEPRLHIGEAV